MTGRARSPGPTTDTGSASVLVLALAGVLGLVAAVLVAAAAAAGARSRATSAADLAVVAAASRAAGGQPVACGRAAEVAGRTGARLVRCVLSGPVVEVEVEVPLVGPLSALGPARGRARAGPATP